MIDIKEVLVKKSIEEISFFNTEKIDRKFICGRCKIDPYTKFILSDFTFSDGSKQKCLIPYGEEYSGLNSVGNPLYTLCVYPSETYTEYFTPYIKYSDGSIDPDEAKTRREKLDYILSIGFKENVKDIFLNFLNNREDTKHLIKDVNDDLFLNKAQLFLEPLENLDIIIKIIVAIKMSSKENRK